MGRPIVYKLQDLKSEDSTEIYYQDELSLYDETDETTYKVEKVLGKKTLKGKKFVGKVQRLARKIQRVASSRKCDC